MKRKTTFKLIGLSAISYGAYKMTTNEFRYYGLIGGEFQIQAYIMGVCSVISPQTVNEAKLLLAETIAVESDNGKAKDYSPNYGEGLTQFDKGTFDYIKEYYQSSRYKELLTKIKLFLGVDVLAAEYTDLRNSPMLSIVFARLLYLKVPANIPTTKQGRWEYYKKWFNSSLGATTKEKYYTAMQKAVFQEVQYV